jgi:hypothetical protein
MSVQGRQGKDEGMLATIECGQYRRGRELIMARARVYARASEFV